MIDVAPEKASLTVDARNRLIQMPPPLNVLAGCASLPLPEFGGKDRPEAVPPEPDGFMADIDASLVSKVLDLAQRQRKPGVEHDRGADHRRRAFETAEEIAHPASLSRQLGGIRPVLTLTIPPTNLPDAFQIERVSVLTMPQRVVRAAGAPGRRTSIMECIDGSGSGLAAIL